MTRLRLLLAALPALSTTLAPAVSPQPILWNGVDLARESRTNAAASPLAPLVARPATGANPATRAALERDGFRIIGYLPHDAYLLDASEARATGIGFELLQAVRPEWKLQPELLSLDATKFDPAREVSLVISATRIDATTRRAIEDSGASVTSEPATPGKPRLGVKVAAADLEFALAAIASIDEVYSIRLGSGVRLHNDTENNIIQSGTPGGSHSMWTKGLLGDGQVIALIDTGCDWDSCYFRENPNTGPPVVQGTGTGTPDLSRRKVIMYDMLYSGDNPLNGGHYDNQGHGTWTAGHAAGSALGSETSTSSQNGVAPLAKLVIQDGGYTGADVCSDLAGLGCPLVDMTAFLDQAYAQGARIHSNSYGDNEDGTLANRNEYSAATADFDDAVWRNRDYCIFVSAGNDGPTNNQVSSPSVGKNVVSVAASYKSAIAGSTDYQHLTGFSSRGYAADGRYKPDITSPGSQVSSAQSDNVVFGAPTCTTSAPSGTSMSCPLTAGCAALIREYYMEGFHPSGAANPSDAIATPSAALVKATLLAGAEAMTGAAAVPPARDQGWGRTNLDNSLFFTGDARKLVIEDDAVTFNASSDAAREFQVDLGGNASAGQIRIALVWTDYPAVPGASPSLVNNLDLEVEPAAGGAGYKGNQFAAGGTSLLGASSADAINNVEMVILPATTTGRYRVRVRPTTIVEAGQDYAIAIGGDATRVVPLAGFDGAPVE